MSGSLDEMDVISGQVATAFPPRVAFAPPTARERPETPPAVATQSLRPGFAQLARWHRLERAIAGGEGVIARMIAFTCSEVGVRPSVLISNRREKLLAHARFAVMWAARELTPYSYPAIARAMGGFDHTSVMHGCARAEELRRSDEGFRALTDALFSHFDAQIRNVEDEPCLPL